MESLTPHATHHTEPVLHPSAYRLPKVLFVQVFLSILLGRRRDLVADTSRLLAPPRPAPQVEGLEHVPTEGAFLIVVNHYARPGLSSWWAAILLTWAIGQARPGTPVRWMVVSEWTWPTWKHRLFITPVTRRLFPGLAHTYNLTLAPPVLNAAYSAQQGAAAVRRFLTVAKEAGRRGEALALAPEGREGEGGALTSLPPGTGRFLLLLARSGLPILPAGVREEPAGVLTLRFGPPFHLNANANPPGGSETSGRVQSDLDAWAAGEVMGRVARLLPEEMRGEYRG